MYTLLHLYRHGASQGEKKRCTWEQKLKQQAVGAPWRRTNDCSTESQVAANLNTPTLSWYSGAASGGHYSTPGRTKLFFHRDQVRQQNVEDFFCSFNVGTPGQDSQEQVSGQKYFRRVAAMGYRSRQSRSPGPGNSRKLKIIETPQRSQVLAQTFDPRYWATATGACTGESRVFGSGSSSPGAYIHLCVVARRPEELLPEQHDGW